MIETREKGEKLYSLRIGRPYVDAAGFGESKLGVKLECIGPPEAI